MKNWLLLLLLSPFFVFAGELGTIKDAPTGSYVIFYDTSCTLNLPTSMHYESYNADGIKVEVGCWVRKEGKVLLICEHNMKFMLDESEVIWGK